MAESPSRVEATGASVSGPQGLKREILVFAEFLAVTWLAVAQPVLDAFGAGAETFVFRRVGGLEIVLFTAAITFAPPVVLYVVERLLALIDARRRPLAHQVLVAVPVGFFAAEVLVRTAVVPLWVYWAAAVLGGAVAFVALRATRVTHVFLRFLAVAPLVSAVLFLATPPVADLAWASNPRTSDGLVVGNPAPVVMIVFDEFPTASLLDGDGQIDGELFPSFARLAGGSTWYPNHSTVSPTTPEAVPAVVTGRYPRAIGTLPITSEHPDNLFTLLDGAYEMNVWEQATQLCPDSTCPPAGTVSQTGLWPLLGDATDVFADLLVRRDDAGAEKPFRVRQSDPSAPKRFEEFVDSVDRTESAKLDYIHAILPHQPWRHLPSGSRYNGEFVAEGLDGSYGWRNDFFAKAARQRHLLQLQRADALLGELLDRLEAEGRYDESLVVVTADHGVSFTAREPIRGVSQGNEEQIMWTPLLVKAPGQDEPAVDEQPVQSIDILPTIADLLDLELPFEVDGRSVLTPRDDAGEDERRIYRWKGFSDLETVDGEDYSIVDGRELYARLLDVAPWPSLGGVDHRLYAFGRYGSLVGESVDQLTIGEGAPYTARINDPDDTLEEKGVDLDFDDVGIDDDVVPTYVTGRVDTRDNVDIVVAVNGTIGGWGPAYVDREQSEGTQSFFALVPESLLAERGNRVEVFAVTGDSDDPVLHPIEQR